MERKVPSFHLDASMLLRKERADEFDKRVNVVVGSSTIVTFGPFNKNSQQGRASRIAE